ncbi:MAG: phosphatidate cytidylyltransferase [Bacteroidetes bacterium]|nr:phosphatidate cytidylyltransferase [Bacteroidota bacterium]
MKFSNLASRSLVAFSLGPLVLAAAYFGDLWFVGLVALIAVVSYWEFSEMALKKEAISSKGWGIAALLFFILNVKYYWLSEIESIYVVILVIMFRELFKNKGSAIVNLGASVTGIFYIGVCASSLIMIREFPSFPAGKAGIFVVSYIVSIWLSDTSAYFGGLTFGKHRLMERVSPKKSWEGFYFGLAGAIASFFLFRYLFLDFLSVYDALALGLIVGIVGPLGDLVESLIKRDAGTKDSSNILAGHGGFFDRFDSVIASAPVIYIYVKQFISF